MDSWLGLVVRDLRALQRGWDPARGGWVQSWRDASQVLVRRRVLVDTQAQTQEGMRVVLRTRVRLTGDVQTDILRSWLHGTAPDAVQVLAQAHFESVTAAMNGLSVAGGMIRIGTLLVVAPGTISSFASALRLALQAQWASLGNALLADRWLLASTAAVALGVLLRWVLRLLLRRRFARGLAA